MYTLSQIDSIRLKLPIFKKHLPMVFGQVNKRRGVVALITDHFLIRNALAEQGKEISDVQIKEQAELQRRRSNLTEDQFYRELQREGLDYKDYLFITRFSMEYSFFIEMIIAPTVSVTDSEIGDLYFKRFNRDIDDGVIKYELVDFSIVRNKVNNKDLKEMVGVLTKFRANGILPDRFRSVSSNDLGVLEVDTLDDRVARVLRKTTAGNFSAPILIGDMYHSFFVKSVSKEVSSKFQEIKLTLEQELFDEKVKQSSQAWLKAERSKYYIKNFL
jgi:hypothetical protein